jgi:hypothetical protein
VKHVNAGSCSPNRGKLGCVEMVAVRQHFDAVALLHFRIDEERNEPREIRSLAGVTPEPFSALLD